MKIAGPDHPISITPNPRRVRASVGNVVIAETAHALTLKEASYPAVQYIPRADADMTLLARTGRSTHCPYKGDASYFSIHAGGKVLENACGLMRRHSPRWRKSPATWHFIPIRSKLKRFNSVR